MGRKEVLGVGCARAWQYTVLAVLSSFALLLNYTNVVAIILFLKMYILYFCYIIHKYIYIYVY